MNKLLQFVLAASLTFASLNASAAVKLGYVKIEKIMQSAPSLESGKKLQNEFTPRKADLDRAKKQLQDKQAGLDKDSLTMSETDRRTKSQELSNLRIELERKERELHEDFEMRKQQELSALQERINKAVASVSQAEGYDLVLYNTGAYVGKKIDITDKVIKALATTK